MNINLTMGLFWVRPHIFLSIDGRTREYFGIELPKAVYRLGSTSIFSKRQPRDETFPENVSLSLAIDYQRAEIDANVKAKPTTTVNGALLAGRRLLGQPRSARSDTTFSS